MQIALFKWKIKYNLFISCLAGTAFIFVIATKTKQKSLGCLYFLTAENI